MLLGAAWAGQEMVPHVAVRGQLSGVSFIQVPGDHTRGVTLIITQVVGQLLSPLSHLTGPSSSHHLLNADTTGVN